VILFGSVDLLSIFLLRVADFLYKAELMKCADSTEISENAVEIVSKRCPSALPTRRYALALFDYVKQYAMQIQKMLCFLLDKICLE
jgi:hypothetical protein